MTIDNIDELYEEIKKLKLKQKEIFDYISVYIKNKSIPINERWDMFRNNEDMFPKSEWIIHYKELESNNINYYDDFNYERHETVNLVNLVERVEDYDLDIDIDKLKEEVLEHGYSNFNFDW